MHTLLSFAERLVGLRRHVDAVAAWSVDETQSLSDWTFDGAAIALGAPWPDLEGAHRFHCPMFRVPQSWPLERTRLALDVGGESFLRIRYANAPTYCAGLDPWHQSFQLVEREGEIGTESVARGLLGQPSPDPRLRKACLELINPEAANLAALLRLVADAAESLADHEVAPCLLSVAEDACVEVRLPTATKALLSRAPDLAFIYNGRPRRSAGVPRPIDEETRASLDATAKRLRENLRALKERYPPQGAIALVGHAHIDTAWLWTLEETRRKVQRSLSTAANLLEAKPEFRFTQSFAEYYKHLETHDADLFARLQAHVQAGRWEAIGGLWVEPDINMPTGESLARQALYGQRYFRRTFGNHHSIAWLPDTFGFSPALPQILRLSGMEAMFTVKLGWSETNRFPHTRFWWEGIDGSRVLVHHFVNGDSGFNGAVEPEKLTRLWRNHTDKHLAPEALYPIGYGDGGGGPTLEMIEAKEALEDFPTLPRLRFTTVKDYFDSALEQSPDRLDCWRGELYLERHRGVLTSQGMTKSLHRRAERDLIAAEALASAAHLLGGPAPTSFEPLWRSLMVNQFHDILPGSSIAEVHRQSEDQLAQVIETARKFAASAIQEIEQRVVDGGSSQALLVINPDLHGRPMRVMCKTALACAQKTSDGYAFTSDDDISPLSATVIMPRARQSGARAASLALENELISVSFSEDGTINSIIDKRIDREVLSGRGNQLWAYQDRPRFFDAWDIDPGYERTGEQVLACKPVVVVEDGPHRAALKVVRRYRSSSIVQHVRLWANSARLEFHTELDWSDRMILLKALFPVAVRAEYAISECAFGVQARPTHTNTSWDAARFEVAAHRFVDLSEPGYGVSLINNGRCGHHFKASELGISLLRSPIAPDAEADEGRQTLTYALLPHVGSWSSADTIAEAEDFNRPLYAHPTSAKAPTTRRFLELEGMDLSLGALKPAEDGRGLVLRAYEPRGARGRVSISSPGWRVTSDLNLLEDCLGRATFDVDPFEIKTWRLEKA